MMKKLLPLNVADFGRIRSKNYSYVDKTAYIYQLAANDGGKYFLSRPRRFGKTLLVDTMQALFECERQLFEGLYIYDRWDWNAPRPVVQLNFTENYDKLGELQADVLEQLAAIEEDAGLEVLSAIDHGPRRLRSVVSRLYKPKKRKVVFLVDEYDKPILDTIDNSELAIANRNYLRGLYGIIKGIEKQLHFVFVTGVSMFSKVSLFSGANNLDDISLDNKVAAICGYTETELTKAFAHELNNFDKNKIRDWYNGYKWRGEAVYNPYDILQLFNKGEFDHHWYKTGAPKMLLDMLKRKSASPMEFAGQVHKSSLISKLDVDDISVEALMFQSGYLTIANERVVNGDTLFDLDYPNFEVRHSVTNDLLHSLGQSGLELKMQANEFVDLLEKNDFEGFGKKIIADMASIPHQWYESPSFAGYENWYSGLLYMCLKANGVNVRAEESTVLGRSDLVVETDKQVFVLEIKVVKGRQKAEIVLDKAMQQMQRRGYANRYENAGKKINLVALVFGENARNLMNFRCEWA